MEQIVTFTCSFTNTGKHRVTTMGFGDVVDEFHDQHCLAHTSTAEEADFTTFGIRREQINNLDPGDENFSFGRLVDIFRRRTVNGSDRPF